MSVLNGSLDDNLFISGRTGSGKSYWFYHEILPDLLSDGRQIIIIDMKGEYHIGTRVNINSIASPFKLSEIMNGKYTTNDRGEWIPPKIVVIEAKRYKIEQIDMIFEYLNYSDNKIIVFEESAFYFGHRKLKSGYIPEETDVFLRTGTNKHNNNHNIIFITQYPNDIPKKVLNVCSRGFLFYLPLNALTYLKRMNFIDEDPETVKSEISPFRSYRYYQVE